jgi:hypothetical protein
MDALTPWLILIIAVLLLFWLSTYCRLRQLESELRNRESIHTEELQEAEAALRAALEHAPRTLSPAAQHVTDSGASATPCRRRAAQMARAGKSALEIARELGLPVREVELTLSLESLPVE